MDCGKKAVKKRTVVEEERAKLFRDSEDTMAVSAGKELKRHRSGTVDGIHVAAGRAKRLWQRKGTNFHSAQWGQWYIAPPKEGSPQ